MVSSYTPATAAPPSLPHAVPSNVPIPRLSPPKRSPSRSCTLPRPYRPDTENRHRYRHRRRRHRRRHRPRRYRADHLVPSPPLSKPFSTPSDRQPYPPRVAAKRLPRGAPGTYSSSIYFQLVRTLSRKSSLSFVPTMRGTQRRDADSLPLRFDVVAADVTTAVVRYRAFARCPTRRSPIR